MATNYPTSLDDATSLPEPSAGATIPAAADTNRSQAIKAVQAKVGIGASTPTANTVLRGTGTGTSAYGQVGVDDLSATGTKDATTFLRGDNTFAAPAGGGGGDLLASNNLSDVANAATSFSNIKQPASSTATGVVELATITEVNTGTDTTRAITPAGLAGSALQTKVDGIETGATADQTDAEIRAAVEAATDSNVFTDADHTKLDGIEASADVTDAANVTTALSTVSIDAHSDVDVDKSKAPADGDVLTFDGTDWNAETPAGGGGGQTLYDAVLDASGGGDYTDWSTAIGALTTGQTLFVRSGTYTETAALATSLSNITIIGENKETSILQLNTASNSAWSGSGVTFRNITLQNSNTGRWQLQGERMSLQGCRVISSGTAGSFNFQISGTDAQITGNHFEHTSAADARVFSIASDEGAITGNTFESSFGSDDTSFGFVDFSSSRATITGNTFRANNPSTADCPVVSHAGTFTGNDVEGSSTISLAILVKSSNAICNNNKIVVAKHGIKIDGSSCNVVGNNVPASSSAASKPIEISSTAIRCLVSANQINGNASGTCITIGGATDYHNITCNVIRTGSVGVSIPSGADNCVVMANSFEGVTTDISDAGTGNLYQTATDSDPLNTT